MLAALSLNPGATSSQSGLSVAVFAVTSAPSLDNTYALNETIRVTQPFGEAVDMTGEAHLKIDMGLAHWGEKWASYETGSGTVSLTFAHVVVEPNISTQVIAVLADTLELRGLVKPPSLMVNLTLSRRGARSAESSSP